MKLEFDPQPIDFKGLDGRRTITFIQKDGGVQPFCVVATPSGISFRGTMNGEFESGDDLASLRDVIGKAWDWHLKLVPKLVMSASGH